MDPKQNVYQMGIRTLWTREVLQKENRKTCKFPVPTHFLSQTKQERKQEQNQKQKQKIVANEDKKKPVATLHITANMAQDGACTAKDVAMVPLYPTKIAAYTRKMSCQEKPRTNNDVPVKNSGAYTEDGVLAKKSEPRMHCTSKVLKMATHDLINKRKRELS